MTSPNVAPEQGVGIYSQDPTQGPACAIACGAGTIYRNYFVELDGQRGQTVDRQINCLAEIGEALENENDRLWQIRNGYALPTQAGLMEITEKMQRMSPAELDEQSSRVRIGVQSNAQVTLGGCDHRLSDLSAPPRNRGTRWSSESRLADPQ